MTAVVLIAIAAVMIVLVVSVVVLEVAVERHSCCKINYLMAMVAVVSCTDLHYPYRNIYSKLHKNKNDFRKGFAYALLSLTS